MRVVVTTSGRGLEALVDPRFGRARGFILVDTVSGETRELSNAAGMASAQGAGVQAAETVSRLGAECLITGHCGPKAYRALQAAGVSVYTGASGTVAEAIDRLKEGRLERAMGPDVGGHWA
jgi:predicted Fe-Mo cluster-binding NifX family protein